ncbi:MAG TPA: ATP-binding cassette domain-containing protein, partial [Kofleriaceae bacterium]
AEHCDELALIYAGKVVAAGTPSQLKREHIRHALLELESDDLMGAYDALKHAPTIESVALFGNALHATVADEVTATRAITAALAARGLPLRRLERIEPSLEDAFVAIIEANVAANAPA